MLSSIGAVGKSSSLAVVFWKESSALGVDVWLQPMWCWSGEGDSAVPWSGLLCGVLWCHKCGSLVFAGLSSFELVNTKWWSTGLQLLNLWGECSGCCSAVVSGGVGSKDRFSLMEIWYIHGVLLRRVAILSCHFCFHNLCLPVWVFLLKVSFNVVTKQLNSISFWKVL